MTFAEIIEQLRSHNNEVHKCFFFWDGPSMERIEQIRRTDPIKAMKLKRPICATCRPVLLKVLHSIYGKEHFDYEDLVSDFVCYLILDDKLSQIRDPRALMVWIAKTAKHYFLAQRVSISKQSKMTPDTIDLNKMDVEEDTTRSEKREFVESVLAAMPNRAFAKLLDDVGLDLYQYQGEQEKELRKLKAEEQGISIDCLNMRLSRARVMFMEAAIKLMYQ